MATRVRPRVRPLRRRQNSSEPFLTLDDGEQRRADFFCGNDSAGQRRARSSRSAFPIPLQVVDWATGERQRAWSAGGGRDPALGALRETFCGAGRLRQGRGIHSAVDCDCVRDHLAAGAARGNQTDAQHHLGGRPTLRSAPSTSIAPTSAIASRCSRATNWQRWRTPSTR